MDWLTWLVTLALVVGGVHWFRSEYLPMLRERAALTDEDRQRERVDVLMALYSLSCGSVRTFVRFERLRAELGWKHYPLREVLAYGVDAGLLRRSGEATNGTPPSGSSIALTAPGVETAEWIRAGCPATEWGGGNTTVINGPVTGSNVSTGTFDHVSQAAGHSRLNTVRLRLVEAARHEIEGAGLSPSRRAEALRLLDQIEHDVPPAKLQQLGRTLADVCVGAAGSGVWAAVDALVRHIG